MSWQAGFDRVRINGLGDFLTVAVAPEHGGGTNVATGRKRGARRGTLAHREVDREWRRSGSG
jgi:hypothetical protein